MTFVFFFCLLVSMWTLFSLFPHTPHSGRNLYCIMCSFVFLSVVEPLLTTYKAMAMVAACSIVCYPPAPPNRRRRTPGIQIISLRRDHSSHPPPLEKNSSSSSRSSPSSSSAESNADAGKISVPNIRNLAVIAHVDHGKTTLMDRLLKQCGNSLSQERTMDSISLERERGITIASKVGFIYLFSSSPHFLLFEFLFIYVFKYH